MMLTYQIEAWCFIVAEKMWHRVLKGIVLYFSQSLEAQTFSQTAQTLFTTFMFFVPVNKLACPQNTRIASATSSFLFSSRCIEQDLHSGPVFEATPCVATAILLCLFGHVYTQPESLYCYLKSAVNAMGPPILFTQVVCMCFVFWLFCVCDYRRQLSCGYECPAYLPQKAERMSVWLQVCFCGPLFVGIGGEDGTIAVCRHRYLSCRKYILRLRNVCFFINLVNPWTRPYQHNINYVCFGWLGMLCKQDPPSTQLLRVWRTCSFGNFRFLYLLACGLSTSKHLLLGHIGGQKPLQALYVAALGKDAILNAGRCFSVNERPLYFVQRQLSFMHLQLPLLVNGRQLVEKTPL